MSNSYIYNVSTTVPGGILTIDGVTSIIGKILENITVPLLNVQHTRDNYLELIFDTQLSDSQKLNLDEYVEQAADYFDVLVDDIPVLFFQNITLPSDGQLHLHVKLQCRKGDGTARLGIAYPVKIKTIGILALNKRVGTLDPTNGQFEFVIGPDHRRGTTQCVIFVDSLPSKRISVEFT